MSSLILLGIIYVVILLAVTAWLKIRFNKIKTRFEIERAQSLLRYRKLAIQRLADTLGVDPEVVQFYVYLKERELNKSNPEYSVIDLDNDVNAIIAEYQSHTSKP